MVIINSDTLLAESGPNSPPFMPNSTITEYRRMAETSAADSGGETNIPESQNEQTPQRLLLDDLKDLVTETHHEIDTFIARLAAQLPYVRHSTEGLSPTDSGYQCLDSDFLAPVLPLQDLPLSSPPDFFSPIPEMSYSPVDKRASSNRAKLEKTIEELIDSEITHVASLKMLLGYYIEPFIATSIGICGTPLVLMENCLHSLIGSHAGLIQRVCSYDWMEGGISKLILEVARLGLNVPLYSDFCCLYDDMLALMKQHTLVRLIGTNALWLRSWQTFLEAMQPKSRKMDLSFTSLLQKPIARVGKYRLMVEAMIKTMSLEDRAPANEALLQLKRNLDFINASSYTAQEREMPLSINRIVNWGQGALGCALSLQFFGKALLVGCTAIIWVEGSGIKGPNAAAFLYKSHLVLCQLARSRMFTVTFIVPLATAQVVTCNKETQGGLYLAFPYTIKVLFEDEECQYEILLVQLTKKEHSVWLDQLRTLVEHVNGPYSMDYSARGKRLCQYPENISPYDICTQKLKKSEKHNRAYFKAAMKVLVELDFWVTDSVHFPLLSGYFDDLSGDDEGETTVLFKKTERALLETLLGEVQSGELPTYFTGEVRRPRLRKRSSWRFASLRGLVNAEEEHSAHNEGFTKPLKQGSGSGPTNDTFGANSGVSANSGLSGTFSGTSTSNSAVTTNSGAGMEEPSNILKKQSTEARSGSLRDLFRGVSLRRRQRVKKGIL